MECWFTSGGMSRRRCASPMISPLVWLAMAGLWGMSQSTKAGSVTSGRVVFLDGYAGSGQYEDGSPGSPLLFVRAARQSAEMQRRVLAVFVEQHPDRYAQLCELLADACSTGVDYRTIKGDLGAHLPELLPSTAGSALFVFSIRSVRPWIVSSSGRACWVASAGRRRRCCCISASVRSPGLGVCFGRLSGINVHWMTETARPWPTSTGSSPGEVQTPHKHAGHRQVLHGLV
jgi:hypothetical protein